MKKLKSELFQKFEIDSSRMRAVLGGFETSSEDDTSLGNGQFDIHFQTIAQGGTITDVNPTGGSDNPNKDKPIIVESIQ